MGAFDWLFGGTTPAQQVNPYTAGRWQDLSNEANWLKSLLTGQMTSAPAAFGQIDPTAGLNAMISRQPGGQSMTDQLYQSFMGTTGNNLLATMKDRQRQSVQDVLEQYAGDNAYYSGGAVDAATRASGDIANAGMANLGSLFNQTFNNALNNSMQGSLQAQLGGANAGMNLLQQLFGAYGNAQIGLNQMGEATWVPPQTQEGLLPNLLQSGAKAVFGNVLSNVKPWWLQDNKSGNTGQAGMLAQLFGG